MADLIVPPSMREQHRAGLRRYLETGEAHVLNRRLEIVGMRADGTEFPVELTITRIALDGPPMFTGFIRDISLRKRREEFDRFLAEAGALLGASLDLKETLESVTRLAVPAIADWCAIDLLTEDGCIRAWPLPTPTRPRSSWPTSWGAGGRRPSRTTGASAPCSGRASPSSPRICRSRRWSTWSPSTGRWCGRSACGRASSCRCSARQAGSWAGSRWPPPSRAGSFDEKDVGLALELGRRCAVAIDNARLYEERSRIAHTLQRSLLPPDLPEIPGVAMEARFRPAGEGIEMGGDFYDVFPVATATRGRWSATSAARARTRPALTALVRYTLRAVTMHEQAPDRVLTMLNEAILRHRSDDRFCSAVFATLETRPEGVRVEIASGGHPLPLVVAAGRRRSRRSAARGLLLGLWPDPEVTSEAVDLAPGDTMILYTDGVTDARAPERILEPDDLARARALLRGAGAAVDRRRRIDEAVTDRRTAEPRDDIALLVVGVDAAPRRRRRGPDGGLRVTLKRRPEAASEARQAIGSSRGAPGRRRRRRAQAPRHGARHQQLPARRRRRPDRPGARHRRRHGAAGGDRLRARLRGSRTKRGPEDESGRGLFIVDALADRWGVEKSAGIRDAGAGRVIRRRWRAASSAPSRSPDPAGSGYSDTRAVAPSILRTSTRAPGSIT